MREKVSTAYFLDDPRKFSSMEEAEKELNRLRAVCVRLKKKQGEGTACKADDTWAKWVIRSPCATAARRSLSALKGVYTTASG